MIVEENTSVSLVSGRASAFVSPQASGNTIASHSRRGIHPFPARMAPEIALEAIRGLPKSCTVFDPMCGSGTVLRAALRHGHRAIGLDIDPLSVLMSRVSTQRLDVGRLVEVGNAVVRQAKGLRGDTVCIPWIDGDTETQQFIDFWFGPDQRRVLRAIIWVIFHTHGPIADALRLAISKIIVTKAPCASLAQDTSHSRPHRVAAMSNYDVAQGFYKAVVQIARELERNPPIGRAIIKKADARRPHLWLAGQVDAVVTSPPYGNAIDYLRGHRLSLVWLGYTISQIRAIRDRSIGTNWAVEDKKHRRVQELAHHLGPIDELKPVSKRRLYRFARDMWMVLKQIHISLRPHGRVVLVVGNSTIKGVFLDNTGVITTAAEWVGLREVSRYSRSIPPNHRYLPPPQTAGEAALGKRMKEEVVLTFEKMQ